MPVPISSCNVFIQIWVDTNAIVQGGGNAGCYMVDNRVSYGSQNEGSTTLQTACSNGSSLCWNVVPIDPNTGASVEIQQIGNSNAWGNTGQPEAVAGHPDTFTGQVQTPGTASYDLRVNVNDTTVDLSPSVNVT